MMETNLVSPAHTNVSPALLLQPSVSPALPTRSGSITLPRATAHSATSIPGHNFVHPVTESVRAVLSTPPTASSVSETSGTATLLSVTGK